MQIIILSRKGLENADFTHYPDDFIISITDPNSAPVKIKQDESNVLRLEFYDIEKDIMTLDGNIFHPISDEQIDLIYNFVNGNKDRIDNLIVQCEAGLSRSAGIGAAISKFYNGIDTWIFKTKCPNMYCYNKMLDKLNHERRIL
jgi:predicted protein tyrosine phosphatase